MSYFDLPTLADDPRRATPKHEMVPHQLVKERRDKAKKITREQFTALIWKLDGGLCRATKRPLKRSGLDWNEIGEVDHSIPKSLAPDRLYDPANGLLLTKRLNRLRKVSCPRAPEYHLFDYRSTGNAREPQTFIWRDEDGRIVRQEIG